MSEPIRLYSLEQADNIASNPFGMHYTSVEIDLARQLADTMRREDKYLDILHKLQFSFNDDGSINVPLVNGGWTIIDADDFSKISRLVWFQHNGYALYYIRDENGSRTQGRLHRLILSSPKGVLVDHINGNPLDNRKRNLRLCNDTGNARNANKRKDNTSGFKGVTFHKDTGKWQASIRANGNPKYLGLFDTKEEAAKIYDAACLEYHGEFAKNNQALSNKDSSHD